MTIDAEPGDDGPDGLVADIVETVLAHPHDLRPVIERMVFDRYIEEAPYDTTDYGPDEDGRDLAETLAPRIAESSQIWPLIEAVGVSTWAWDNTPERAAFDIWFRRTWDREHGFTILVDGGTLPFG